MGPPSPTPHPHSSPSITLLGGTEAKKDKTTTVVQGPYHPELDQEYVENRPGASPAYLPICHSSRRGPYIDLRIYRATVFLCQVTSRCNAGYADVLCGLHDQSAEERYRKLTGNTIMWSDEGPTDQYWDHTAGLPETTVDITTALGPHGRWVDIGRAALSAYRYHIKCKHHECPGPYGATDAFVHVHGQAEVPPEVQDAMRVLLAELYASDAPDDLRPCAEDELVRLHPMPAREGPRTYLDPKLKPGIHVHVLLHLATVRGYILAMDAGTPGEESMKAARQVEFVDEPAGMSAAIAQVVAGLAIVHTVMRGPGTAQEGESHSINLVVQSVHEADLPPDP